MTKYILCYGDSNTWGWDAERYDPKTDFKARFNRDNRWTGRLQKLLGDDFYVIEEGLNGRTTNLDSPDPPDRNGKNYLPSCLYSHAPLNLVILMLGGNDLKSIFHRSAKDAADGLAELINIIQSSKYGADMQSPPSILIIGYPVITNDTLWDFKEEENLLKGASEKSKQFDFYFSALAHQYNCHYFNAAPYIHLSKIDGVHFDAEDHAVFAELMAKEVRKII